MKKKNQNEKKLSLKKLQMAKIDNPDRVYGGTRQFIDGCANGDDGSLAFDDNIKRPTTK
ncbi:hypothetical protein [uncultured Chryseobacterium sp.]|uniref:hypothetical protein n=1 Tax=uncultured Chryseobacterium sp. TaxID=259322 RepID=UPI0025CC7926|nr:hypothetical protein [uncultured Chryseobacterium sp.]